ncbi:YHS domain-containing protein [Stappia sp. F7233]|uniref:YHS domain-containing protein n=1 Tax=Stappia albiluteola TaxID=2758565 RepID=A0A839A9X5_9HYPH|nr:YHS domain-containing protein [Stappia albiluteola]MBA5775569.1 YHS domain-containing protein [Stappia albiluteola]
METVGDATKMFEDPVCGMTVRRATARFLHQHVGEKHYFCSECCEEKFEAEPEAYLKGKPTSEPMPAGTILTGPVLILAMSGDVGLGDLTGFNAIMEQRINLVRVGWTRVPPLPPHCPPPARARLEIIEDRFAWGEICKKELEERRRILRK